VRIENTVNTLLDRGRNRLTDGKSRKAFADEER
jgi:hypothetical protein